MNAAQKRAHKKYYQKNRQQLLANRAQYYQQHKTELQSYGREYQRKKKNKQSSTLKAAIDLVKQILIQELVEY